MTSSANSHLAVKVNHLIRTFEKTDDGEGVYDSYNGDYGFDKNDAQGRPFPVKFVVTTMKDQSSTLWAI